VCFDGPVVGSGGFEQPYVMLSSGSYEQDKAFYLLTIFESDPSLLAALAADPIIGPIATSHDMLARDAPSSCGSDVACYTAALEWSTADVQAVADELPVALAGELPMLAATHLRPSGTFALYAGGSDAALLSAAWTNTAATLNGTYGAYAATLDAASLDMVVSGVIAKNPDPMPFFAPLLQVDLAALVAEGRDEATLYDPLAGGENAAAVARIPTVDWSAYPYTVILVPGQGPPTLATPLDPEGQERCDIAVQRFQAGYAPFLAVSGGHVHPDLTPYCEALEMKQYLMTTKGVPESAILVDPYARHTDTNVRDVSRLLYRYGIPTDRPALVTSDLLQSLEIGNPAGAFDTEAQTGIFYLPYRVLAAISPYDSCLLPSPISLTAGDDPLDP
jgi:hypothetical protein